MTEDHRLEGLQQGEMPARNAGVVVGLAGALLIVIAALGGTLAFTGAADAAGFAAAQPAGGWAIGGVALLFCAMLGVIAFFWRAVGERIEGTRQPVRARSRRQP